MEYRTLGRTRLKVSEIGFGCGNVGGLMVRGSLEEQVEAVSHALALGINYFDTAPMYGNGRSETNLGQVFKELRPGVTVGTKVAVGPDDVKDFKGTVQSSLETSLRRLGRDRVDLLQLHTPITLERGQEKGHWSLGVRDVLGAKGIADAMDTVRSQGMARFVGFTGLGETAALHETVNSGRFDTVQAYYNLLNPTAGMDVLPGFAGQDFGGLINLALTGNMGVIAIRVMAGGALSGAAARRGHAAPAIGGALADGAAYEKDEARAERLGFLVSGSIASLSQAALRFVLMHRGVSTAMVGFSNVGQIDEAADASGKRPISKPGMEQLSRLWSTDFGL